MDVYLNKAYSRKFSIYKILEHILEPLNQITEYKLFPARPF